MVGYADPCPLCGNNKRRRFGHASRSDDGTFLRFPLLPLPPTLRPKSKSDPTPLPAPPTGEIVVRWGGAKKPASPPAATSRGIAGVATPSAEGAIPALSLPKASLSGRLGITSILSPESIGVSNRMTAARPPTLPVKAVPAAAIARGSSSLEASGPQRKLGTDADGSGEEEGVNSKKFQQGERESPCAAAPREASEEEDMEEAAMRIRCKCGRVQEFLYRQRTTTT